MDGEQVVVRTPRQQEEGRATVLGEPLARWRMSAGDGVSVVQAVLAPTAARRVARGVWDCLNVVAITARINRRLLLIPERPTALRLKNFADCAPATPTSSNIAEAAAAADDLEGCPAWPKHMHHPSLVLEWLTSSSFVRDQRKTEEAAKSLCRILERSTRIPKEVPAKDMPKVNNETLRLARAWAGVFVMMLWRLAFAETFQSEDLSKVHIFLFSGASPQWRGVEVFCSSFDLVKGDRVQRRLMPFVCLSRNMLNCAGKTVALMWQLWLLLGPNYRMFRAACRRVRAVTSDLGVEKNIVESVNNFRLLRTSRGPIGH